MSLLSEHAKLLGAAMAYLDAEDAVEALRERMFASGNPYDLDAEPDARAIIGRLKIERDILRFATAEARGAHFARTTVAHLIKRERAS